MVRDGSILEKLTYGQPTVCESVSRDRLILLFSEKRWWSIIIFESAVSFSTRLGARKMTVFFTSVAFAAVLMSGAVGCVRPAPLSVALSAARKFGTSPLPSVVPSEAFKQPLCLISIIQCINGGEMR
jgi:hypothetical protein